MYRVLAPGGRVVINTPGRIQPCFEAMEQAIVDNIDPSLGAFVARGVLHARPMRDSRTCCDEAGFSDVTSKEYTATFDLPAPAEFLWSYINLTPMGPLVRQSARGSQGGDGAPGRGSLDALVS